MRRVQPVLFVLLALGCSDDDRGSSGGGSNGGAGVSSGSASSGTSSAIGGGGGGSVSGGTTGSAGGLPPCVTEVVLLAEAGQTADCSYPLPPGVDDANANVVLEVADAPQPLCRRASSQGCDVQSTGGWWTIG